MAAMYALESSDIYQISDMLTGKFKLQPSATDMSMLAISGYFVFAAAVIDFFDGFVARFLRAESEFGKQLDSLADMVTFGFVPGVIMYKLIAETIRQDPNAFNATVWPFYLGFLITLFAAVRLAKFNTNEEQSSSFKGLPTPAAAIFVASLPFIMIVEQNDIRGWLLNKYVMYGITIALCYLMTSNITMFSLKFKHFQWKGNEVKYAFLGISVLFIITMTYLAIPLIIILYVILSVIINQFNREVQG